MASWKLKKMTIVSAKTLKVSTVICLYLCLLAGSICILQNGKTQEKSSHEQMIENELKAMEYLRLIYDSQQKYYAVDWDGDKKKEYAKFVTHLWQTVDNNANPLKNAFIPKELAFAMGEAKAIDGYYFLNVYYREKKDDGVEAQEEDGETKTENNPIDFEKEWVVSAMPADRGRTGLLTFIMTSAGKIYAKDYEKEEVESIPENLVRLGWKTIAGKDDVHKMHSGKDNGVME